MGNFTDAITGGLVGMGLNLASGQMQLGQQQNLQDQQIQGQMQLSRFQRNEAMQYWRDTNFKAQMEQLKQAGLNPALIYKNGGQGGTTQAFSGNVSGGQATDHGVNAGMAMQMGMQSKLLEAQTANVEADTKLKEATAAKTAGVDTDKGRAEIATLTEGINNQKAQAYLQRAQGFLTNIQGAVANATQEEAIDEIRWNAKKAFEELRQAENETFISERTKSTKVSIIEQTLAEALVRTALLGKQISLTDSQIQEISAKIQNMDETQDIAKFQAEINANNPGLMNTIGGEIQHAMKIFRELTGTSGTKRRADYKVKED